MTELILAGVLLLLVLLNGFLITAGRHWIVKTLICVATPFMIFAVWWAVAQQTGWPAHKTAPNSTTFIAAVVRAPSPGNAGEIDIWGQPPRSNQPRAYKYPYSPQLEQKVAQAAKQSKRGPVGMRTTTRKATKKGGGQHGAGQQAPRTPQFYQLPPGGTQQKESPS